MTTIFDYIELDRLYTYYHSKNKLVVVIDDKIYDVTEFKHPGGKHVIVECLYSDITSCFHKFHPKSSIDKIKKYLIGFIKK